MGKRIQITESQLRYIIENANRIDEQSTVSPQELVEQYMTSDLNELITKYKDQIVGQTEVTLGPPVNNQIDHLIIGEKQYKFTESEGFAGYVSPIKGKTYFTKIKVSDILGENLFKELVNLKPEYSNFFAKNDEVTNDVKNQIDNIIIDVGVNRIGGSTAGKVPGFWAYGPYLIKELKKKKVWKSYKPNAKSPFKLSDITPLSEKEGTGTNSVNLNVGDAIVKIESANIESMLSKIALKLPVMGGGDPGVPPKIVPTELPKPVDLGDLFGNNQYILNQDSDKFKEFIRVMKNYISKGGKMEKLVITASASRVPATKDKVSGKDWRDHKNDPDPSGQNDPANYYLSKARAENARDAIVEQLKIPAGKIEIKVLGAQGPKWKSGVDANDDKYRKYRFVRVDVIAPK